MSIKFRIDIRCDRCGELYSYIGESKSDMPSEHRILPDDWGRVSDNNYQQVDLCVQCLIAFNRFLDAG